MRDSNFKKTDLLRFQKSLNDQFMSIFEEQESMDSSLASNDVLGLVVSYRELNIFISLNDLQNISTNLQYENTIRTKSWILGYNHEHGNLYTIINFMKLMDFVLFDKEDFDIPTLNINSNILYFKKSDKDFTGLLVNEFKLDYTAEYTLLFNSEVSLNEDRNIKFFSIAEGIDFNMFLKKENMSKAEWDLLQDFLKFEINNEEVSIDFNQDNIKGNMILTALIDKVYLDAYGQRPVFRLDIKSLLNYISTLSPL